MGKINRGGYAIDLCLLEAKSNEQEMDDIRTSGRGVERCSLGVICVLGDEKQTSHIDEDEVLVLRCSIWMQDDYSISMGQGCTGATAAVFGGGYRSIT